MYRLIPDLQYWVNKFLLDCTLNKYNVCSPFEIGEVYLLLNNSFIRLLFDDSWPSTLTSYKYCYKKNESRGTWPRTALQRIMVYSAQAEYFETCDSSAVGSINIFNLLEDDLLLLDRLLDYRLDSTGVTIIDIDYNSLTTNLSKLIYTYLKLKIQQDCDDYNTRELIADATNVLENLYEIYVIENVFTFLNARGT